MARYLCLGVVLVGVVCGGEDWLAASDGAPTARLVTKDGGRVAWYQGSRHELIAFDAVVDSKTRDTELFTMEPDGSNRRCVTCDSSTPKGFVGQPDWLPDGEHLIFQAENGNARHRTRFTHVSWGFDNDLWTVRRDGSGAQLLYESPPNHAALHPHVSRDGTTLIFAEHVPTAKSRWFLKLLKTPGGENPWDGWQIHVADVDLSKTGTARLSNHRVLFQGTGGFYETHGFTDDGQIVFSHTAGGQAYVDDIYVANLDGTGMRALITSPRTWDEHGTFSPSGRSLAFNSSRGDPAWAAPRSKPNTLTLELYLKTSTGAIRQLTHMNAPGSKTRYLTSDFDWDRIGTRIIFQAAPVGSGSPQNPELWMLTFPEPQ